MTDTLQSQVGEDKLNQGANQLPDTFDANLPPLVEEMSKEAKERFLEFFLAEIRNENTRKAYGRAVARFLRWAERQVLSLEEISPMVVSAYVEHLKDELAPATVKQHLSAIRRLFGYLQAGNVLPENPAEPVKGPKHSRDEGSTPILTAEEARDFLEGIPTESIKDKRDKALIGVLTYTFARVSAITKIYKDEAEGLLPGRAPLEGAPQGKRRKGARRPAPPQSKKTTSTPTWRRPAGT